MSNMNVTNATNNTDNIDDMNNNYMNSDNINNDNQNSNNTNNNNTNNTDITDNLNKFQKNIIHITDFNAPELDVYARYTEVQLLNRHYPEKGLFIAESPLVVERALNAGCVPVSCLVETKHIEGQAKHIIDRLGNIPVYTAEFNVLTQLTGFPLTRGMLCCMKRPKLPALEEICKNAKRIAILENVMNPTNVGAIFRSAAALSIDAVLLTPACSNPLYRRAIRVSMGTVFQIPWTFLGDEATDQPATDVETLKSLGFKTAAMALTDNCVSIDNPSLMAEEKLAIILGTEGEGLATSTIEACDYTIKIPMAPGVDSLNVAAASAVAFWQLGRK
jgi:tRNA G18 (ribose-2'-O)-methylase SpoU